MPPNVPAPNNENERLSFDVDLNNNNNNNEKAVERTFIAIKPDSIKCRLAGKIIDRFEERGFNLVAIKMINATREQAEKHYFELRDQPFFPKLIDYMTSGRIVVMVWEGKDVVKQGRALLGATSGKLSKPGTIRGDFCALTGHRGNTGHDSICHGSDCVDEANREISIWFKPSEIIITKMQK